MTLPVYIPDWQIGDGDIAPPAVGQTLVHVLVFHADTGEPGMHYGSFGRETTVTGMALPLSGHSGRPGSFPTALHCFGFMLYWDAPARTEGPVTLTGIVSATDYGTAPAHFPQASGRIESVAIESLLYVAEDAEGRSWVPAPGRRQEFKAVDVYPQPLLEEDSTESPQMKVTGVLVELNTGGKGGRPNPEPVGESIRIRMFPDFAKTVLWLFGPVSYPETALSRGLAADLTAWESGYYESVDDNMEWNSPAMAAAFDAQGELLGQRVADELGAGFEVEFSSYAMEGAQHIFSSTAAATNPAAAAAFNAMVAAETVRPPALAEQDGTGWFAHAPLSGTVFNPGNVPLPQQYQDPAAEQ